MVLTRKAASTLEYQGRCSKYCLKVFARGVFVISQLILTKFISINVLKTRPAHKVSRGQTFRRMVQGHCFLIARDICKLGMIFTLGSSHTSVSDFKRKRSICYQEIRGGFLEESQKYPVSNVRENQRLKWKYGGRYLVAPPPLPHNLRSITHPMLIIFSLI